MPLPISVHPSKNHVIARALAPVAISCSAYLSIETVGDDAHIVPPIGVPPAKTHRGGCGHPSLQVLLNIYQTMVGSAPP